MKNVLRFLYGLITTILIVMIALIFFKNNSTLYARITDGISRAFSGAVSMVGIPAQSEASTVSPECWGDTGIEGIRVYEYGRSLLMTDEQRSIYDKIAKAVLTVDDSVTIKTSLQPEEMQKIYKYYAYDHAENFYLSNASIYYNYTTQMDGKKRYTSYSYAFQYQYDKNTVITMRTQLAPKLAQMLQTAADKNTPLDKERALHDALVGAVRYDSQAAADTSTRPDSFTIYGALVNGSAVCDGYAKTLKLLLDNNGQETLYVTGKGTNSTGTSPHAWNLTNAGGKWYYIDATFDDPIFYNTKGQRLDKDVIDHTYFNFISDDKHVLGTFDASNPFADSCENYETMPPIG